MDIYENIIVGNFLFGLGVKLGTHHSTSRVQPISVNLLQQTPLDQRLGDVVIANMQIFRLIEFKRSANNSRKELIKWRALSDALELKNSYDLTVLSRKIHWYVNSDFREATSKGTSSIQVFSYLDSINQTQSISLSDFVDQTAEEAVTGNLDSQDVWWCKRYVELVASIFGDVSGASGCLLLMVTGSGQLTYVAVDDIGDLVKTPTLVFQRNREREVDLVREQELRYEQRERTREREIEPPSQGLSL